MLIARCNPSPVTPGPRFSPPFLFFSRYKVFRQAINRNPQGVRFDVNSHDVSETAPARDRQKKRKISGVARPLRFSVCVRRDVKSLPNCLSCCDGKDALFPGLLPSTHEFSWQILLDLLDSIWMRAVSSSDRIFALGHRTSVFSVHPADPPLLSDHLPAK